MISIIIFKLTKISKKFKIRKFKNKKIKTIKITIILILVSQIWTFPLNDTNNSYSDIFQRINMEMLLLHRIISKLQNINTQLKTFKENVERKITQLYQNVKINKDGLKHEIHIIKKIISDITRKNRIHTHNEIDNIHKLMVTQTNNLNEEINNLRQEINNIDKMFLDSLIK